MRGSSSRSRARIVEAADDARRRIKRDLHDGAQQRLVALALSLQLVGRSAEPATAAAVQGCIKDLHSALAELRELHPAVLTERGLPAALQGPAHANYVSHTQVLAALEAMTSQGSPYARFRRALTNGNPLMPPRRARSFPRSASPTRSKSASPSLTWLPTGTAAP